MANYDRRTIVGGAPATTLASGISSGATSIVVAAATGWPDSTNGDFFIVLDRGNSAEEKVRCASRSGTTITVQTAGRGSDGTSAAAHSAGVSVEHCITAVDANEANYAVSKTVGKATAVGQILVVDAANSFAAVQAKTSGQVLIGSGTTLASVPLSGDVTVNASGVVAIGSSKVTSAMLVDGTIVNADINASAAIALSKLATDPLARANHTGTQLMATISDAGSLATLSTVDSAHITDGTIATGDLADASITIAKLASGIQPIRTATSAPSSPVAGQLWYDTDDNLLYVYNGTDWVCITPQGAVVSTQQTTSSTSYTNLGTTGPAVTVNTGTKALVTLTASASNNTAGNSALMSFTVSGASTVAADDHRSLTISSTNANLGHSTSAVYLVTGLTAGANTFTSKYRAGVTGTAAFDDRGITVVGVP